MTLPSRGQPTVPVSPVGSYIVLNVRSDLPWAFQLIVTIVWAIVWLSMLLSWTTTCVELIGAGAASGTVTFVGRRMVSLLWASGEPRNRERLLFCAVARPGMAERMKRLAARIPPRRRPRRRERFTDELPSCVRDYLPTAVRTAQADRQKGYPPSRRRVHDSADSLR